jgi:hypothetical protein
MFESNRLGLVVYSCLLYRHSLFTSTCEDYIYNEVQVPYFSEVAN